MLASRPVRDARKRRAAPRSAWARAGLIALGLSGLMSEGCSSLNNGCGGCGGLFNGRLGSCNLTQKLFHRRGAVVAADSCDGSLGSIPVQSGDPALMTPGSVLTAPPPSEADPLVEPLPKGGAPSGAGTQGSNAGTVKSIYQTRADRPGDSRQARRGGPGTMKGESPILSGHPSDASDPDPLSNLPGLTGPAESLAPETSPPSSPTAGDRPGPSGAPASPPSPKDTAPGASAMAPGIRRFHVVEPWFAAGTVPTDAGCKWLSELGYKTVIDLRETKEVKPEEVAAINHHGFRYVSLPTSPSVIEPSSRKAFEDHLARVDSQPVYAFDADGNRPASLAFLHLVLVKKADRRTAEREVEDLGSSETALWKSALGYLGTQPSPTASTPGLELVPREGPRASSEDVRLSSQIEVDDAHPSGEAVASLLTWGEPFATYGRLAMALSGHSMASLSATAISAKWSLSSWGE